MVEKRLAVRAGIAQVTKDRRVRSEVHRYSFAEFKWENSKTVLRPNDEIITPEEAVALEEAGLEFVLASGFEGGGHRGSFLRDPTESLMGTFSLIPQVADAVGIPVIAAGGIADRRGLAAAVALGAEAVVIGTAFLLCAGSSASKAYQAALLSTSTRRTGLTDAFTGRLARAIKNRLMDDFMDTSSPPLPFPLQHALTQTIAVPASAQERMELMTLWAGQSAGLCRCTEATQFMAQLIAEAEVFFSVNWL